MVDISTLTNERGEKMTEPAKDSAASGVWRAVGVTIAVLVGLVVLFYITKALLPEIFGAFNGTLSVTATGLTEAGLYLNTLGMAIGIAGAGFFGVVIRLLMYAFLIVLAIFIVQQAMKKLKPAAEEHH